MTEKLIKLNYAKDKHIALWKTEPEKKVKNKNILLIHGTFSNRKVLNVITKYLVDKGFTCYNFEWRNHGESSKTKEKFNFETIAKKDFKIVFNYLFDTLKIEKIDCITHSGGGICLTMFLILNQKYISKINSIVFFGCQAFGASTSTKNYYKILVAKYASKLLGFLPAKTIGGAENESYYFMKQWFNWNLNKNFLGENKFDYRAKMKNIQIPILSISGEADKFIAPKEGCEAFLNAFKNPNNKHLNCGLENGFLENYNHGRILHSKNASKEIYPLVLDWIED